MCESESGRAATSTRWMIKSSKLSGVLRTTRIPTILVVMLFASATETRAQNPRLELGRRLARFENAWETAPSPQQVAAVPFLKTAVRSFFSLQLSEAGRQLDQAWLAVSNEDASNGLTTAMIGSQLLVSPRCAETGDGTLELQLTSFYPTDTKPSPNTIADLKLTRATGDSLAETQFTIPQLANGTHWKIEQIPEGDHILSVIIRDNNSAFALPPMTVSRITGLKRRVQQLKDASMMLKEATKSTAEHSSDETLASTLRDETRLIENVIEGLPQEADFPLLYRLKSSEAMLASRSKPTDFADQPSGARQAWLTLAKGLRSVPTRLHLPQKHAKPAPVLVVFHGAGGSENMFFETYGAGRVIAEAANRGWIVISPRQALFGLSLDISEMLDALEAFVPLDRKRIMLLGHSMGASQVVKQVRKNPTLPIAAIALGGGGRLPSSDAKRSPQLAWYIGAGDQDFGLAAAQQLNQSLTESEIKSRFKVYANIEHLVVVQAAIDDSFEFLDEVLNNLPHSGSGDPPNTP